MKRLSIMILVVIMVFGLALGETTARYDEAAELINQFNVNLKELVVLVLSKEIYELEDGTAYECKPFNGLLISIKFADDVIASMTTSMDQKDGYTKATSAKIIAVHFMTFSKTPTKEILPLFEYLSSQLKLEENSNISSRIDYEKYKFNLITTPDDIFILETWPLL